MHEYFVSPFGSDDNEGREDSPFLTIQRGLQGAMPGGKLQPGETLILRGGIYNEPVHVADLLGEEGHEITIRSHTGERAVIETRINTEGTWVPAGTVDPDAHPDEWAWSETFPEKVRPTRGAFLDAPYRRLVSYTTPQDFRSGNQTFGKRFDVENFDPKRGPYKVTSLPGPGPEFTYPWVYMGPGLFAFHDETKKTRRIHVRLSHTNLDIPGLENYLGPTDPNVAGLAVCDREVVTLTIDRCRYVSFSDLTIRFGGRNTIEINSSRFLRFEDVEVQASTGGIRFGGVGDLTFRNCRFDGGLPPWFFRSDKKGEYDYLLTKESTEPLHNSLGAATVGQLMYGEGPKKRNFEIEYCEFVNGHDLYLVAENTDFHHNWIDNVHDEGVVLDTMPSAGGKIYANVITRCLSPISMAGGRTAEPWLIYRNLVDLRQPTAGRRPRHEDDQDVFRFGNVFKSEEDPEPNGPFYIFHNTFLVVDQREQASYLHYRSTLSPHLHLSLNNIFVAFNLSPESDVPISFIPLPILPCPTDGNIYHRYGAADGPAFRSLPYKFKDKDYERATYMDLEQVRNSPIFRQSKEQYVHGYEAHSQLTDPGFLQIGEDGRVDEYDDLRLGVKSAAHGAGVPLPDNLQLLDEAAAPPPPLPFPKLRDAGCYHLGSVPFRVGVHGQRRFPANDFFP